AHSGGEEIRSRFMALMCVHVLEVEASHEPQGRARHSVRAVSAFAKPRRARSDAPYHHGPGSGVQGANGCGEFPPEGVRGNNDSSNAGELKVIRANPFTLTLSPFQGEREFIGSRLIDRQFTH